MIKPGDWVVYGLGRLEVGWSSALDRQSNRSIDPCVRQVKSVRKSVMLHCRYGTHRIDVEQVIGVFDSQEAAARAVKAALALWQSRTPEIQNTEQTLERLKAARFEDAYREVVRQGNR